MTKSKLQTPICSMITIYLVCFLFRAIEYLLLRTDQSIFGEAFVHKLTGILLLIFLMRRYSLKWYEIGFTTNRIARNIFRGLLLGAIVFFFAYGVEAILQLAKGGNPSLQLYVTSYAIDGNQGRQTGLLFFLLCVFGNIINVVMEEGVFRGLFVRLAEQKYTFLKATAFSSLLFGIWHVAAPLRSLLDREISTAGAMMAALMLMVTTVIAGIKFCLLVKLTGSLWMPMADHFFNNTIINLLHIVTATGADELQVMRISVAQTLSCLIVLVLYRKSKAHQKPTFRI